MAATRLAPRRGRSAELLVSLAAVPIIATLVVQHPLLIANRTPSEPEGLYLRTFGAPKVGRIIAFQAPAAAFPYADRRLAYLHRTPILKVIAAGPGDHVCTSHDVLNINGQDRAPILRQDGEGTALPRWRGCRALEPGEFFVFSDRVPNSFDSRYFGPVSRGAVIGVFQHLDSLWEQS